MSPLALSSPSSCYRIFLSTLSLFLLLSPSSIIFVNSAELYDYHKVYCGRKNCYDVLDIPRTATTTEIKTAYRKLSKMYHPDHNKEKSAIGKTRLINKAYEVLGKNATKREEYDYLLKHPEEYGDYHGHYYFETYAPQSDAVGVVIGFLIVFSLFQWYLFNAQYKKRRKYLEDAIIENLGFQNGGSLESIELRKQVLSRRDFLIKEEQQIKKEATSKGSSTSINSKTNRDGISNRQKKKQEKQTKAENSKKPRDARDPMFMKALDQVLNELEATEGALFKKPDPIQDLLLPQTICLPYTLYKTFTFQFDWYYKHTIQKLPLSLEEQIYLCKKTVGVQVWQNLSEDIREEMRTLEIWEGANYQNYKEIKLEELQSSNDPEIKRLRKKFYKMADAMEDEPEVDY